MLVNYSQPNVHMVYFPVKGSIITENVMLIGGVNKVPDKLSKQFKDNKSIKDMFDLGILKDVYTGNPEDKVEPMATSDLARLDTHQAISIVRETLSKDLLDEWSQTEGRIAVQNSVVRQLKKLELTDAEKKELGID